MTNVYKITFSIKIFIPRYKKKFQKSYAILRKRHLIKKSRTAQFFFMILGHLKNYLEI